MDFKIPNQESYPITHFKKGDIITRVEPVWIQEETGDYFDPALIGNKLIYLGIANGCIYFERGFMIEKMLGGQIFFVHLYKYGSGGWNYYEEPEFLEGKKDLLRSAEYSMQKKSREALDKIKEKAIKEENYKLVARISKKLKELKNEEEIQDLDNPFFLFGPQSESFGFRFFPGAGEDDNFGLSPDDEDDEDDKR